MKGGNCGLQQVYKDPALMLLTFIDPLAQLTWQCGRVQWILHLKGVML